MATVILVHGISNMPEKKALIQQYHRALAMDYRDNEGLDLTTRVHLRSVHWADVLYEKPLSLEQLAESAELSLESAGALATGGPSLDDVDETFLASLGEELGFDPDELRDATRVEPPAEFSAVTAEAIPLPWFLKKPLMRAAVRDTHHYLFNVTHSPRPSESYQVRDEIRQRFVDELKAAEPKGPIVMVTHSMGTVIAYDCLKNVSDCPRVKHLMTVGSPLGMSEVQNKLAPGYSRNDGFPAERVDLRWVNIYDPVDIVSRADPWLRGDYRKNDGEMVEDIRQSNGGVWTHPFTKYAAGKTLRDTLRELL